MRHPYRIHFQDVRHTPVFRVRPDSYEFKPVRYFKWLQRIMWKYLMVMGSLRETYDQFYEVTTHLIDADTFMERLYKQNESLYREFKKEGSKILIGSEDYAELMNSPEAKYQNFSFNASGEFYTGNGYNRTIFGLTVEVIPWMRGMVVMP